MNKSYIPYNQIAMELQMDQSKVDASIKQLESMGLVVTKTEIFQEISLKKD